MSSIAIFQCCLTGGAGTVGELSSRLKVRPYTDKDLVEEAVRKYGGDPAKVQKLLAGKVSVFNKFTLDKEKAMAIFRSILASKLEAPGNHLFFGLHPVLISQDIKEVLKVLVVDSKESRIQRGIKEGLSEKQSKEKVRVHDVKAVTLTDFLFKKDAYDASLFDLVIPLENCNHLEISEEIMKYFQSSSLLRTKQSQQAIADMKLEAAVSLKLLNNGHNLRVSVHDGEVTITVSNSLFNLKKLEDDLRQLVQPIDGILELHFDEIKTHEANIYRQQKFELPSRVLFVDDEKDFVHTVSERLINRNVGTFPVYDGEMALDIVENDPPDVMVLDLKMPGIHGTEVLKKVKQIKPDIEVIILTGHGSIKDEQLCMELGAFAYLTKPIDIELLTETIRAANQKIQTENESDQIMAA